MQQRELLRFCCEEAQADWSERTLGKLRIVVAEDHEDILRQIVRLLGTEFEVVDAVTDGRSLLTAAIALHPDVIVSDVCMPLLSGPQVMQKLSASGYKIPFVFESADVDIRQCAASFVTKADLYHELLPAVRAAAAGQTYVSPSLRARQNL